MTAPPAAAQPTVPVSARADAGNLRARYRRIMRFAVSRFIREWWYEIVLVRMGLGRISQRTRERRLRSFAQDFRDLAVDLGGLMIKVGQFMSSRLDVLPPELTTELAGLQDEVPAVPFAELRAVAEAELGEPLEQAYEWFDATPLAAASLGQAHRARLRAADASDTGFADVVVKVQRPGIHDVIEVDLSALRRVARILSRVRLVSEHVDAPALVEEFAATTRTEVDYEHEARAAAAFAARFADDERVSAPEIAWERSTRRVLTLEDVTAIKISDVDALRAANIEPADVAQAFATAMFQQVFGDGVFHADPHPGNVFVTPLSDDAWRLTFIDFGMTGRLPDDTREALQRMLLAVVARDGEKLVAGMSEVGVLLPSADTVALSHAMTELFARFGGMGFAQLREVDAAALRDFGNEFGEVIRALPFQLPENFLLLIRAVSLTSGVCSGLDPRFNIWDAVEPFAGRLLQQQGGGLVRDIGREAAQVLAITARLPKRIDRIITRAEQGRLTVATPAIERRLARIELLVRRAVSAVLFAALLLGGALLLSHAAPLGIVLMGASVLPLLHAVFAGAFARRSRQQRGPGQSATGR